MENKVESKDKVETREKVESKEFQPIVRIAETEIKGELPLNRGIWNIKGIGHRMGNAILTIFGNAKKRVGDMSEDEIRKVEEIIKEPGKYGIPVWMLNRKKDYKTGENLHVIGFDLDIAKRDDIKRLGRIRSYRGVRLQKGLTVRGQRTRSSGRTGGKLGVMKKSVKEAAAPAKKEAPAAGGKAPAGKKGGAPAAGGKAPAAKPAEKAKK